MTDQEKLQRFGDIQTKMNSEGVGYYILEYASPEEFDFEGPLEDRFLDARDSLDEFISYVNDRIKELGGNPEDYDV